MTLLHIPTDSLNEEHIQDLINRGIRESRHLEYKEELPDDSPAGKIKFLKNISAIANSGGGEIFFGIKEKRSREGRATDVPGKLVGVQASNSGELIGKYTNWIKDWIKPRVNGIVIHPIPLKNKRFILMIRIPRSLTAPHMTDCDGNHRFYGRTSHGSYEMEISEIRSAFLASQGFLERVRNWREQRIRRIERHVLREERIANLAGGPILALHMAPLVPIEEPGLSVKDIMKKRASFLPIGHGTSSSYYNEDGVRFIFKYDESNQIESFVQVFRSSSIEALDTTLFTIEKNEKKMIPSIAFEEALINAVGEYSEALKSLDVQPPISISISVFDVMGFEMAYRVDFPLGPRTSQKISATNIFLPSVLLEEWETPIDKALKPALDVLWNACGFPECMHYDKDGNWRTRS